MGFLGIFSGIVPYIWGGLTMEQQIRLKYINRRAVLNYIREHKTATKAGLAAATGLTFAAIKKILDELERSNLVRSSSIEKKGVGRNSLSCELNPDYGYIVAVYINRKAIDVAVLSMGKQVLSRRKLPMENRVLTQNQLIESILRAASEVMKEAGLAKDRYIGVGIGVPGPIDVDKGMILTPPNMPVLHYLPLKDIMEAKLGLPVYIQKDANVIALGEYWSIPRTKNLIYLDIDMGIGSGIIINGSLNIGGEGKAGEFGHMTIDINGPQCKCGNCGCLEAMGSGLAVLRDFGQELAQHPEHPLYSKRGALEIDDIIQDVKQNDMMAISIINRAAYYVGVGVANVINFLDPQTVVLGGLFLREFDGSFDIITDVASQRMLKSRGGNAILKSNLGNDAGVLGCAEVVMDHFFQDAVNNVWRKSQAAEEP